MTTSLFSYKKFWPAKFGAAPVLPMSREEMDDLGWDSCDIIIVTGDAYVDHPSFGMAMIGRLLESQGFRVGIIAQPDWHSAESFMALGRPNLFFGITAGNMDSMVNHYTADRKPRSDDAYTAGGEAGKRPNRAAVVYSQRAKEAYKGVPVVIGGIEASLRRIAQFDYWTDKVRRSVLPDSKADMLIFGNAERAIVVLAHRLAANESIAEITDIRGTAFMRQGIPSGWTELDSTQIDEPDTEQLSAQMRALTHPYEDSRNNPKCEQEQANATFDAQQANSNTEPVTHKVMFYGHREKGIERETTVIRLPSYDQVIESSLLYAHASRVFHLETNPGNARAMVQKHGKRDVWLNPPAEPLNTAEFDGLFAFPYTRQPHPRYEGMRIPAYEMIRFSINIMRGCFGGCTFCSITEHEGRIIQSRSEQSVLDEIEAVRDTVPGFTGVISDLGGPTANMYRLACKDKAIEQSCRKLSCVYPGICPNLNTNHKPLTQLYRKARSLPGVKKVAIASGLRYDLAVTDPEYVKELVTHHVGGRLKIAPEHTESGPLSRMMKPGIGSYYRFKQLFDKYSQEAGKKQYLIPYFISSHPGTADEDMLNLALWLKKNNFRPDQVQAFLPTPMALATAMYHSGYNPLKNMAKVHEPISVVKKAQQRRLHKAFLRYHDAQNHDLIRRALKSMGREDLIGHGADCLVPAYTRGASRGQGLKRGAYQGKDLHHRIEAGAQLKSTKNKPAKKKRKFSSSASAASSADARKSPSRHHKNAKPTGKSSSRNRRNKPH